MPAHVLMVIASRDFRDEELALPRAALRAAGARVTLASSSLQPASGMLGARETPDRLYSACRGADYDAVVFVGGLGAREYFDDAAAHRLAREAAAAGGLVAAQCYGPSILARAGLLAGRRATCHADRVTDLREWGAGYAGTEIERSGPFLTGAGPEAAAAFGAALVAALAERPGR